MKESSVYVLLVLNLPDNFPQDLLSYLHFKDTLVLSVIISRNWFPQF